MNELSVCLIIGIILLGIAFIIITYILEFIERKLIEKGKNKMKKNKMYDTIYEVLIEQIKGMIEIEIGNYLVKKSDNKKDLYYHTWRRIRHIYR